MLLKKLRYTLIATASLLLISSCANTAHVVKTPGINLDSFKTYSWSIEDEKTRTKNRKKELLDQRIHAAVDKQLQKQGLTEVNDNPDLMISTDLVIEKTTQQKNDPVYSKPYSRTFYNRYTGRFYSYYFPSEFMGYDNYTTNIREGTLTVTMVDTKTDQAVWQGWATRELAQRNISDKEIEKNVKSIFKKYK